MSTAPTKRHPLSNEERQLYDAMIQCIRVLADVSSYYFLTGDPADRQEVAREILKCTDLFYAQMVPSDHDCGRNCFDGTRCVKCPGPDPLVGDLPNLSDLLNEQPGWNEIGGNPTGPRE